MHTLSFVPTGKSIYPEDRSQLPPVVTSEMGDSMDADLLPELSGDTWVASALLDELTLDLPTAGVDNELVTATCEEKMLQTVRSWVESGNAPFPPMAYFHMSYRRPLLVLDWHRNFVAGDYKLKI